MEQEKISVVMSVYNERPAWLRASIESILGQTHRNIEFIIVLDAPDNTELEEIILEYAAADSRIVFLKNTPEKRGRVFALNRGIDSVTGQYIAILDADDIADPVRLETELRVMTEESLDLVAANLLYIDEDGVLESDPDHPPYCFGRSEEACPELLRIRDFLPQPTFFARAETYRTVGPYHEIPRAEDYEWLCRAAALGMRMRKLETPLIRYRRRRGSISTDGAYVQKLVSYAIRREYRRALAHGRDLDEAALQRAIAKIDLTQDGARYKKALQMYYAAWARMKENVPAGIWGLLRAFCTCPILIRLPLENRQMARIDAKYSPQ